MVRLATSGTTKIRMADRQLVILPRPLPLLPPEGEPDYLPEFSGGLNRDGFNVLLAEYRGYGGSTGRPALAAMLVTWIRSSGA